MTRFLVLYRASESPEEQLASATTEQAQAGLDAWMAWRTRAGDAVVDLGAPVASRERLGPRGSAPGDGVCGFSIVEADSKEAAVQILDDHPHLRMGGDSSIEVLEFLTIPGM